MKRATRAQASPGRSAESGLFRALAEQSRDVVFRYRVAPSAGFTYVSPSLTQVSGYTPEELYADSTLAIDLVHPDDRPLLEAVLGGRQAPPDPFRLRWRRKDGQAVWVELRTSPYTLPDGSIGLDGVARDITREIALETDLRQTEQRFRALFDQSPLATAISRSGHIVDVNQTFVATFRLADRADAIGSALIERIVPAARADRQQNTARRAVEQPIAGESESTGLRADGSEFPVRVIAGDITLPDGLATLAYVRDLTQERAARAHLVDTVRRLEATVTASPLPIFTIDLDGRIASWNEAAERVFGWSAAEVIGRPNPTVPPDLEPEYRANIATVVAGGQLTGSFRRRRRDGEPIEVKIWTALLRGADPTTIEILSIAEDVTQRSRAERALRASEERFRSLLEASPAAIVVVDQAGRIVLASPRVRDFFGYEPADLEGQDLATLVPDGFREQHAAQLTGYLDQPVARPLGHGRNLTGRRRDGAIFPAEIGLTPWRDPEGQRYVMATIVDITRREQLAAQLHQALKFDSVGQLAGGIAHDFNNLVMVINGFAELASAEVDSPDRLRDDLTKIREAGDRAASLTRQLLAFARRQVLEPVALDINAVVADLRPMLTRSLGEDIELVTALDPALGSVMADRSQLEQVIVNLALNARDAMPDGGRLLIETANTELDAAYAANHLSVVPGRYVTLVIGDTGVGMDADTLSRAFEPFFTTKGPDRGTGLGLATVYGIVKQSGGNVWAYSEPGAGSTFKIYLPRADGAPAPAPSVTDARDALVGSETVLLVEDDAAVRAFARSTLEHRGYRVLEADDARRALLVAAGETRPIDLLITDVVMPGMRGTELAAQLRETRPTLPVLYTSGYTENGAFRESRGDGSAFLAKPFSGTALARKVRETLDR